MDSPTYAHRSQGSCATSRPLQRWTGCSLALINKRTPIHVLGELLSFSLAVWQLSVRLAAEFESNESVNLLIKSQTSKAPTEAAAEPLTSGWLRVRRISAKSRAQQVDSQVMLPQVCFTSRQIERDCCHCRGEASEIGGATVSATFKLQQVHKSTIAQTSGLKKVVPAALELVGGHSYWSAFCWPIDLQQSQSCRLRQRQTRLTKIRTSNRKALVSLDTSVMFAFAILVCCGASKQAGAIQLAGPPSGR